MSLKPQKVSLTDQVSVDVPTDGVSTSVQNSGQGYTFCVLLLQQVRQ